MPNATQQPRFSIRNWLQQFTPWNLNPVVRVESFGPSRVASAYYDEFANAGYAENPIVYACVNEIALATKSLGWQLTQNSEVIHDDNIPAQYAEVWKLIQHPNAGQTLAEFLEWLTTYFLIAGDGFVYGVNLAPDTATGKNRARAAQAMYAIRPNRVKVLVNNRGIVTGYEVDKNLPTAMMLPPEEMLHLQKVNPRDDLAGMSPMQSLVHSINGYNAASVWNENALNNAGVLDGLVIVKGKMDKVVREEFQRSLDTDFSGVRNAHKVKLLHGADMEYKQLATSPKDMDWSEGKRENMRDICRVFGVPSQLLGDQAASTYSNYKEARRAFCQQTVLPLAQYIMDEVADWLLTPYGDVLGLKLDLASVDVLREDENELYKRLSLAPYMTINEKRTAVGLDERPDGDVLMLPVNVGNSPVGGFSEPTAGRTVMIDGLEHRIVLFPKRNGDAPQAPTFHPRSMYPTLESRARKVDRVLRMLAPKRAEYAAAMGDYWRGQKNRIVRNLARLIHVTAGNLELRVTDFPYNAEDSIYSEEFHDLFMSVISLAGDKALKELGKSGTRIDISQSRMNQKVARTLAARSKLINEATARKVQAVLDEAVKEGVGIPEMKYRIIELYDSFGDSISEGRAGAVARTEVGLAASEGDLEAYREAGVMSKEWITARDGLVRGNDPKDRASHVDMDGQVVGIDEDFEDPLSGNSGPAPGMFNAPEDDINCRCTTGGLYEGDEAV